MNWDYRTELIAHILNLPGYRDYWYGAGDLERNFHSTQNQISIVELEFLWKEIKMLEEFDSEGNSK